MQNVGSVWQAACLPWFTEDSFIIRARKGEPDYPDWLCFTLHRDSHWIMTRNVSNVGNKSWPKCYWLRKTNWWFGKMLVNKYLFGKQFIKSIWVFFLSQFWLACHKSIVRLDCDQIVTISNLIFLPVCGSSNCGPEFSVAILVLIQESLVCQNIVAQNP